MPKKARFQISSDLTLIRLSSHKIIGENN